MDNQEFEQKLSTLEKKVDKLLKINIRIAKALHLLPVSEKEEKEIQLAQRNALATAAKVNDELNIMENKSDDDTNLLGISLKDIVPDDAIYSDIIASDYLGDR